MHCIEWLKLSERNEVINSFISAFRKIILKCPAEIKAYKELDIPSPPDVVITRWATWLNAAYFYGKNFEKIESFIRNLNSNSAAIIKAKEIISSQNFKNQLLECMNYYFLSENIKFLETKGLIMEKQYNVLQDCLVKLETCSYASEKLKKSFQKSRFRRICQRYFVCSSKR